MSRKIAALLGAVALSGTLTLAPHLVQPGGGCHDSGCSAVVIAGAGTDGTRVTVAGQNW
jgi:hypothetical protein